MSTNPNKSPLYVVEWIDTVGNGEDTPFEVTEKGYDTYTSRSAAQRRVKYLNSLTGVTATLFTHTQEYYTPEQEG